MYKVYSFTVFAGLALAFSSLHTIFTRVKPIPNIETRAEKNILTKGIWQINQITAFDIKVYKTKFHLPSLFSFLTKILPKNMLTTDLPTILNVKNAKVVHTKIGKPIIDITKIEHTIIKQIKARTPIPKDTKDLDKLVFPTL